MIDWDICDINKYYKQSINKVEQMFKTENI